MDYLRYYLCSLVVAAGVAGFLLGGQWLWLGAVTFPVLLVLDLLCGQDYAERRIAHPVLADLPLYLHIVLMIALYGAFAWRMQAGLGAGPGAATVLALIGGWLSMVWLNIVPTVPVVHELMHRHDAFSRACAKFGSAFFADANRDIAHIGTHHIHFDTAEDSDTARRGENTYAFMWRATRGSYLDAWHAEKRRLAVREYSIWSWRSAILWQLLLVLAIPAAVGVAGGWLAAGIAAASMVASKFLLEALNFLQHYGLVREPGAAMGQQHTWNHLSRIDRIMGYEITTHIDHHKNGDLRFDQLKPYPDAPQMPSVFVCAVLALIPPLWTRFVQPRLQEWDRRFATPAEQRLAREANRAAGWPDWLEPEATAAAVTPAS